MTYISHAAFLTQMQYKIILVLMDVTINIY